MNAHAASSHMTIGDVIGRLSGEFPDVTISKIRFLETEGLIEPERTPAGYRKFSHSDVERLRFILTAQRDQYLPLRVIKERLAAVDWAAEPVPGGPVQVPGQGHGSGPGSGPLTRGRGEAAPGRPPRTLIAADTTAPDAALRLTRQQVADGAGIGPALVDELEDYGLIRRSGRHYDGDALTIARAAAALGSFGVEVRHLRAAKSAADREIGLIEQVIAPLLRQRAPGAHGRAEQSAGEIAALLLTLHAALVSTGLRESLGR